MDKSDQYKQLGKMRSLIHEVNARVDDFYRVSLVANDRTDDEEGRRTLEKAVTRAHSMLTAMDYEIKRAKGMLEYLGVDYLYPLYPNQYSPPEENAAVPLGTSPTVNN